MDWTEEQIDADVPIPARVYRPALVTSSTPLVLHLHSGAFVAGSPAWGRVIAEPLAASGAVVVSPDYPHAPAYQFPHTIECVHALLVELYRWRTRWAGRKSPLFVAGEEAGGNLAAGAALLTRDRQTPPLAGQILISPMLDPRLATCSMRSADAGPVGCRWADGWRAYLGSAEKAAHPYASPLASSRLAGLAPALILTAQDDLLRDESLSYADRLREAGVSVTHHILPGPTGWPCSLSEVPPPRSSLGRTIQHHFTAFFDKTLARPVQPDTVRPTEI